MELLKLLSQRRVQAGIIGLVAFVASMYGVQIDQALVLDQTANFIAAIGSAGAALLALHSYLFPKK